MSHIDVGNSIMHLEMRVVKKKSDDKRAGYFEKPSPLSSSATFVPRAPTPVFGLIELVAYIRGTGNTMSSVSSGTKVRIDLGRSCHYIILQAEY